MVCRENINNPCKVVQIIGSFAEYIASLDRHFAKELEYKLRRLKREYQVTLVVPETESDLQHMWNRFVELHVQAVEYKGASTVVSAPEYERFYYSIAEVAYREGSLALMGMKLNEEIAAVKFMVVRNKTCFLLNSGYQRGIRHSLYLLSTVLCIEKLLEKGVEYFDFMGGGGRHKTKLGGVDRSGLSIQIGRRMTMLEVMTKEGAKRIARRILKK